ALVLIEASVLGREKSLLHLLRDVGERHPDPPLVLLEYLGETFPPPVEYDARAGQPHALELGVIGQIGSRLVVEIDHVAEIHRRYGDGLVLAELAVCGLQIGEIDAVKSLVLAGNGLWVVYGGGDEVLEVDVLDVEGLTHVGAAPAQELRHELLIPSAVEARLHLIRRSRDLTERQRGRKDLDQDRFHRTGAAAKAKGENCSPSKSALQNGFLRCLVPSVNKFSCRSPAFAIGPPADTSSLGKKHPIEKWR